MRPKTPSIENCELSCSIAGLAGFFVGLAFGFLLDGVLWAIGIGFTFANTQGSIDPTPLHTILRADNLEGLSGWGIIIVPLSCAVVAAVVAVFIARARAAARA